MVALEERLHGIFREWTCKCRVVGSSERREALGARVAKCDGIQFQSQRKRLTPEILGPHTI